MLFSSRLIALAAGTTLALTAFGGPAVALEPGEVIPASDEPGNGLVPDGLEFCFDLDPANCQPDETELPEANPGESVSGTPTFTG